MPDNNFRFWDFEIRLQQAQVCELVSKEAGKAGRSNFLSDGGSNSQINVQPKEGFTLQKCSLPNKCLQCSVELRHISAKVHCLELDYWYIQQAKIFSCFIPSLADSVCEDRATQLQDCEDESRNSKSRTATSQVTGSLFCYILLSTLSWLWVEKMVQHSFSHQMTPHSNKNYCFRKKTLKLMQAGLDIL